MWGGVAVGRNGSGSLLSWTLYSTIIALSATFYFRDQNDSCLSPVPAVAHAALGTPPWLKCQKPEGTILL